MKQQINIKVFGSQEIDGETQEQEIDVKGEYYVKDGKRYVLYEEIMEEPRGKVRTIVKEVDGGLEVVKNGYISVKMKFSEGLNFNSVYETPMGSVKLRTITRSVEKVDREGGFNWTFKYAIYMDDQYIGENVLGLDVQF